MGQDTVKLLEWITVRHNHHRLTGIVFREITQETLEPPSHINKTLYTIFLIWTNAHFWIWILVKKKLYWFFVKNSQSSLMQTIIDINSNSRGFRNNRCRLTSTQER